MSAGALPQTPLGELTAPPRSLLDLRGPTSKERGEEGKGGREWRGERGGERRGAEGTGVKGSGHPNFLPGSLLMVHGQDRYIGIICGPTLPHYVRLMACAVRLSSGFNVFNVRTPCLVG